MWYIYDESSRVDTACSRLEDLVAMIMRLGRATVLTQMICCISLCHLHETLASTSHIATAKMLGFKEARAAATRLSFVLGLDIYSATCISSTVCHNIHFIAS